MMRMRRGPGLIGAAARTAVVAGTATAVSGRVARRQQRRFAAEEDAGMEQPAVGQVAAGSGADADPTEELTKLAQLHQSGALSDEEFAAAKARLLGL